MVSGLGIIVPPSTPKSTIPRVPISGEWSMNGFSPGSVRLFSALVGERDE